MFTNRLNRLNQRVVTPQNQHHTDGRATTHAARTQRTSIVPPFFSWSPLSFLSPRLERLVKWALSDGWSQYDLLSESSENSLRGADPS